MLQESTVGTAGALALRGVNRFFRDTIMSYQTWQRKIFARVITARASEGTAYRSILKLKEKTREAFDFSINIGEFKKRKDEAYIDGFLRIAGEVIPDLDESLMLFLLQHIPSYSQYHFIRASTLAHIIPDAIAKRSTPHAIDQAVQWVLQNMPILEWSQYNDEMRRCSMLSNIAIIQAEKPDDDSIEKAKNLITNWSCRYGGGFAITLPKIEVLRVRKEREKCKKEESHVKSIREYSKEFAPHHNPLLAQLQLEEDTPDAFEKAVEILAEEVEIVRTIELVNLELNDTALRNIVRSSSVNAEAKRVLAHLGESTLCRYTIQCELDQYMQQIDAHDLSILNEWGITILNYHHYLEYLMEKEKYAFAFRILCHCGAFQRRSDIIRTLSLRIAASSKPEAFKYALALANTIPWGHAEYPAALFDLAVACKFKDLPSTPAHGSLITEMIHLVHSTLRWKGLDKLSSFTIEKIESFLLPDAIHPTPVNTQVPYT
jgi:hypothetical protein